MTLATTKTTSLRNRVRVTNKTRLRISRNLQDELLELRDDDEGPSGISTAGVDIEDAKEHHLQAVLSAAVARQHVADFGGSKKSDVKSLDPAIPVPDHTGLVDDYDQLYPPGRWTDPAGYIKVSSVVEESVADGLAGGMNYYMDEQDKEWLDSRNDHSKSQAQSARVSQRSSKVKGKEPEVQPAFPATQDEFELVMGLLEVLTDQKSPFTHHNHNALNSYLPFAEYEPHFSTALPASLFAGFSVPTWVPSPSRMVLLASAIYPHWKERRIMRAGHRIIPSLNYDESDLKNESYVCFRRREVKAVRKTRTAHAFPAERLQRLQKEVETCHTLARKLCEREALKRDLLRAEQAVWIVREQFADLKRQFPALDSAGDEDLLVDKAPVPVKRPKQQHGADKLATHPIKTTKGKAHKDKGLVPPPTPIVKSTENRIMHPHERYSLIVKLEEELQGTQPQDTYWEDSLDNSYQSGCTPWSRSVFKPILQNDRSDTSGSGSENRTRYSAVRVRRGRGGVLRVDRRASRNNNYKRDSSLFGLPRRSLDELSDSDDRSDTHDDTQRRMSQWLFDSDDDASTLDDERDRTLVDDFSTTYVRHNSSLISLSDLSAMTPDFTFSWTDADGTVQKHTPYVVGQDREEVERQKAHVRRMFFQQQQQRKALVSSARRTSIGSSTPRFQAETSPGSSAQLQPAAVPIDPGLPTPPPTAIPPNTPPDNGSLARSASSLFTPPDQHSVGMSTTPQALRVKGAIHIPCVSHPSQIDVGGQGRRFGTSFITAKLGPLRAASISGAPSDPAS